MLLAVLCVQCSVAVAQQDDLSNADTLRLTGRYEEAFEQYSKSKTSCEQVIGQAKCLAAMGKSRESVLRLKSFLKGSSADARVHSLLSRYYFESGNWEKAQEQIDAALSLAPNHVPAQFHNAELKRVQGQLDDAKKIYGELAGQSIGVLDVEDAQLVARAMAIHGRWTRDSQVFDRLVNDIYPQLLQKNAMFWPAYLESGRLFLEKYNVADAARELKAALAINPRAAEVHVELGRLALQGFEMEKAIAAAERALKINENSVAALQLTADITFVNLQPKKAMEPLLQARSLNAYDEATLGRLLAVYLREDGLQSNRDPKSRAAQLTERVLSRNQRCGDFFAEAGEAFDDMRIYPMASKYYQLAIEKMPELIAVRGSLGMVQMRLGQETAARTTLEESFKADPFNARVKNTLDVLDLLDTYAVLETDHFILRFDRGHDGILAEYAARFLEDEVYPDIVAALGYEPKEKTLLEIFSSAQGTSGHSWFSARMVGLPFIGPVGACAGKMFALTSPGDGQPYNWARVLRHEFVHVVNLQQTNFLIPHWFTEAIAVRNENVEYPADWERILTRYVAEDSLFKLANINHGFVRPGNGERWTLAYFQSYLYADFLEELGGKEAIPMMLELFAQGKSTADVVEQVSQLKLEEFENEYREFLVDRAKGFGGSQLDETTESIDELETALQQSETDREKAISLARLSAALTQAGDTRKARRRVEESLKIDPRQPLANYVMARLLSSIGDDEKAWEHIEAGLDQDQPDAKLLAFAANVKLVQKDYASATELYRRGQKAFPTDMSWTRGLARTLLRSGEETELAKALGQLADREADKTTFARKLTLMALAAKDYIAAEKWATRVLHVDISNPIAHAQLGKALAGQNRTEEAIYEYEMALRLSPNDRNWKLELKKLKETPTP